MIKSQYFKTTFSESIFIENSFQNLFSPKDYYHTRFYHNNIYTFFCSFTIFFMFLDICTSHHILVVTVTPLIGYLSQYRLIIFNQSVGSFSIDVCAILLIANILRIVFWFTNGFAINLLFQSFLIIFIQVLIY